MSLQEAGLIAAIAQATEAIVITDCSGSIQYVNPAFTKMTGYSSPEAVGQNPRLLKSGTQDEAFYKGLWATISAGGVWQGQLVNRRKDGSCYMEEMSITPVKDAAGVTTTFIAIKQDVTDRRAAEDARRFLAAIVESSDDAIFTHKLGGGAILSWNRGAEALLGYRAEEAVGKPASILIPPERLDAFEREQERLKCGEAISAFEAIVVGKHGKSVHVSLAVSPIKDEAGTVVAAAAIIRDITARKRAEEKYRRLVANLPDVTWSSDVHGHTNYISPNVKDVFGYTAEEICEKGDELWFGRVHPDDVGRVLAGVGALFETNQPFDMEYRVQRKDGRWIWVQDRAMRTFVQDGTLYADGVFSDITARKQAEEELRKAKEAADTANRAKDALLREVHHRVKNNLQMISSLLSLQQRRIQDEQARRAFEDSRLRIHSVAMVHEALYRSHDLARVDFAEYTRNLTHNLFMAYGVEADRVALEVDIESVELSIDVAVPCALILSELAGNSLKHAFSRGERGALRITFRRDGDSYRLEAADTGAGAPAGVANSSSFGLRLVSILAGQLDGKVEIHPENGFRVAVTFPAAGA